MTPLDTYLSGKKTGFSSAPVSPLDKYLGITPKATPVLTPLSETTTANPFISSALAATPEIGGTTTKAVVEAPPGGMEKAAELITEPLKGAPGLMQVLADIQENPLSIGSSIMDIAKTPYKDFKEGLDAYGRAMEAFGKGLRNNPLSAETVSKGLEAATAFGAAALTPITTWFNVASKIPVVGTISKLLFNVPFATIGDVSGDAGVVALHSLPISDEAKQTLEPAVRNISALVGQIAVGGKVLGGLGRSRLTSAGRTLEGAKAELVSEGAPKEAVDNIDKVPTKEVEKLNGQFGKEDAKTIIKEAAKTAIEAPKAPEAPKIPAKVGGVLEVPKELQPLAEEAKKFKSAEEFINNLKNITRKVTSKSELVDLSKEQLKLRETILGKEIRQGMGRSMKGEETPLMTAFNEFRIKGKYPPAMGEDLRPLTDFYDKAVGAEEAETAIPKVAGVPKELQPLAEEARKYKSAEEFVSNIQEGKNLSKGIFINNKNMPQIGGEIAGEGILGKNQPVYKVKLGDEDYFIPKDEAQVMGIKRLNLTDFYNQAVRAEEANLPLDKSAKTLQEVIIKRGGTEDAVTGKQIPMSDVEQNRITQYASKIARLEGKDKISAEHLAEAFTYKNPVEVIQGVSRQMAKGYYKEYKSVLDTPVIQRMKDILGNDTFTNLYNQAVGGVKAPEAPKPIEATPKIGEPKIVETGKPESVKVSRSQLPVGEGIEKVSRLEARIKERLGKLNEEEKATISTYSEMNKADQIKAAVDYVVKNPDEAIKVLRGEKPAPKGLLYNSVFLAMEEQAKGDTELGLKLASLRSTRAGQEISILTERDPNSPVKYMTNLETARVEAIGGREKAKSLLSQEMEGARKSMKKSNLAKVDWDTFIESIRC